MSIHLLFRQHISNIPREKFWVGFLVCYRNNIESNAVPNCKAIEIASIGLSIREDKREINGFSFPNDLRCKYSSDQSVVPSLYVSIEDPNLVFTEYRFLEKVDFVFAAKGGKTLAELAGATSVTVFSENLTKERFFEIYEEHSNAKAVLLPIIDIANGERQFAIGDKLRELNEYHGEIDDFCKQYAASLIETYKTKSESSLLLSFFSDIRRRKKMKRIKNGKMGDPLALLPERKAPEFSPVTARNSENFKLNTDEALGRPLRKRKPEDHPFAILGVLVVILVISLLIYILSTGSKLSTGWGCFYSSLFGEKNPECQPPPPCQDGECNPILVCPANAIVEKIVNRLEPQKILLEIERLKNNPACTKKELAKLKEIVELLDPIKLKSKRQEPKMTVKQFKQLYKDYPNVQYFKEAGDKFVSEAKQDCVHLNKFWHPKEFECFNNYNVTNSLQPAPAAAYESPTTLPHKEPPAAMLPPPSAM